MINARAEGISTKSAFRRAFAERRCLVPADGFYEWTGLKGARRPFLLRPRQGGLIAFAAIWERWLDRAGGETYSVAIITCDANATVAPLHDRMPVVLGPEHFEAWLDCKTTELKAAQDMLQSAPDDLFEAIEMHPQINDSRRDEPGIQQPLQTQLLL
jgi:putative SOS response-associated peptidase YedK